MTLSTIPLADRFPRSAKYNLEWMLTSVSGAANPLWITEWLTAGLDLRPGMRILDLGCGRAVSSIFLRREFGAQVWATDLWFSVSENFQRIRDAGVDDGVLPLHADARALPFAADFFDAILCIDCFPYFGTDDGYLNYVARFVKPGGLIAIAGAGLMNEIDTRVPEHLRAWWTQDLWCLHSAEWWRRHWARTGIVDVEVGDSMPEGWKVWLDWHRVIAPENRVEIEALEADAGRYIGYTRTVARRRSGVELSEWIHSIPAQYVKKPMIREIS